MLTSTWSWPLSPSAGVHLSLTPSPSVWTSWIDWLLSLTRPCIWSANNFICHFHSLCILERVASPLLRRLTLPPTANGPLPVIPEEWVKQIRILFLQEKYLLGRDSNHQFCVAIPVCCPLDQLVAHQTPLWAHNSFRDIKAFITDFNKHSILNAWLVKAWLCKSWIVNSWLVNAWLRKS